jgi:cytochrome P450 family 135
MAATSLPPGPRLPALVQAALWARHPVGWLERRRARYGDCFSGRFPYFGRIVYLAHPDLVREVFRGDPARFHAGEANAGPLGPVLGEHSVLTLDEDAHLEQRKLLLPPFHGEAVRRYGEVMARAAEQEVESWPVGEEFSLRAPMQRITLEVILRAVFGVREEARLRAFREWIPRLADASSVAMWLPFLRVELGGWTPAGRALRMLAKVDELIYEEIRLRRQEADDGERDDVLSLLLAARHEDGSPMSDVELRDELMTLLTAGHETTATGLSWAFERLLRTPGAMDRLLERLDDDEYVDAVVKETLRVRPVITDVARKLTEDTDIAGYRVPAGTIVLPVIALLHLREDTYPDPHAFRPERFLDGAPDPYTWIPFGGGVRRCIGAAFAQFEMRVVLRAVLQRARLRAADPAPEPPRVRHVTIVPAKGTRVVLQDRLPAAPASPAAAATAADS